MRAETAYEIVSRRRPHVITRRLQGVVTLPWVYVNGRLSGSIAVLHDIDSDMVEEIRFVSGNQATMRYGGDHSAGAIEIRTVIKKSSAVKAAQEQSKLG